MGDPKNRASNRVPLSVEVALESEHNFYAGLTNNISEGGLFVATNDPPPVGTEVKFELIIGERRFPVAGVVCWIRDRHLASDDSPEGCGIRWRRLDDDALATIQQFIRARDTLFYEE
jgi:uncharacterized protein (TIGR02266 family)